MNEHQNRRQFTRVPIRIKAEVSCRQEGRTTTVTGQAKDVSMKGIYLVCPNPLPLETDCEVSLFLSGSERPLSIQVKAKVARVDDQGMGIEFTEIIGLESYNHLRNLVLYNAPEADSVEDEIMGHLGIKPRS